MSSEKSQLPLFSGLPYRPQEARPQRTMPRTLRAASELPFRSGVSYGELLPALPHLTRRRLLRARGSYVYLDRERLLAYYEVERVAQALESLLDTMLPVYAWWNRIAGPRAMTTWWTVRGGRIRTWNGKAPLWLVFGTGNSRFIQRATDVLQRTGAVMHVEPGPEPLQEGLELAELLVDGALHRFCFQQDTHPLMYLGPDDAELHRKAAWLRQLA